ncbi:unnamed protein product [marine sediment metagenome]|uniref:Uncharacterized protein n=1 Tax=marine sediment metagenome TaxID=412755 RepID=X1FPC1_9ZZZZ
MSIKFIPLMIVVWLIAAGMIIIPRFFFIQPITANATNADILNAVYSLKDTIYTSMGIGVGVILAVMLSRK